MTTTTIKSDLHRIADFLSEDASYSDVMYELFVRMKVEKGKAAADRGDVVLHEEVKRQFSK
jgi:predicted transcriptional regulator